MKYMKDNIEFLINKKRELLELDGTNNGLRLHWVDENNYSIFYKGNRYVTDDFSKFEDFLEKVLNETEKNVEEKAKDRIVKQLKAEEKEKEPKVEEMVVKEPKADSLGKSIKKKLGLKKKR